MTAVIQAAVEGLRQKDPQEKEFHQAADEVLSSLEPLLAKYPQYAPCLERCVEPERVISFRVPWVDRNGKQQINRGYRVEFNSAIGPYKGGLRFHPTVNLSVLKFLGFEQVFKNSLTGLMMGGGKGGSDFDPKGKNDNEVMAFCQSFMTELSRHIGPHTDVPAGDIGVGGREIGYLFGQYKRIRNEFTGVLTGKAISFGGSLIRPEATGYGLVYFAENMLKSKGQDFKGKRCILSGAGNVAQYAAELLLSLGALPLSFSDSAGWLYFENGMSKEDLDAVMDLKNNQRGRLSDSKVGKYTAGSVWDAPPNADIGLPCATQNEIDVDQAKKLVAAGVKLVAEGANMPSTTPAINHYVDNDIFYGPAKAANAGGVAVSGLEMSQDATGLQWTREEVDNRLKGIMKNIFDQAHAASQEFSIPLFKGANVVGAQKVFDAMLAQGVV